jgi:hypothetical protein
MNGCGTLDLSQRAPSQHTSTSQHTEESGGAAFGPKADAKGTELTIS